MINPDLNLEKELWNKGFTLVCGIDEVGRGPLAGPVVAGAVIFSSDHKKIDGIRDSKLLSLKQRNILYTKIQESCVSYGVGIVSAAKIDELGITKAIQLAMQLAIKEIETKIDERIEILLIDGANVLEIPNYKQKRIKKGDMLHYSISAASIIAKVTRDNIMCEYARKYPEYGFEHHVGYGTKAHIEALDKYGVCDIHRKSFKPVSIRC